MREPNTDLGAGNSAFPKTRWSVIRNAADPTSSTSRESLENLMKIYWRPVYAHFRRKWNSSNEEAKDLTQDFFLCMLEKEFLDRLGPEHGRFRSYVLTSLDNFVRQKHRRDGRQKRGGHLTHFSLDIGEGFLPDVTKTPEQTFEREWRRTILALVLEEMERDYREQKREVAFRLLTIRDLDSAPDDDSSYESLAKQFGLNEQQVTNYL